MKGPTVSYDQAGNPEKINTTNAVFYMHRDGEARLSDTVNGTKDEVTEEEVEQVKSLNFVETVTLDSLD